MKIDLNKFNELVEQKYIRKVEHENGKLVLFVYTEKCEYERFWTPETRMARGLIVEKETGLVVAKPFEKFFNLGQHEETYLTNLPNLPYTVQEKMDGSLGIIYYYGGKWNVATKGSFTSDQALKATEMLRNYDIGESELRDFTFLVEIIYPANKIVVSYNEEKLVLLSMVNINSGKELHKPGIDAINDYIKFSRPKTYKFTIDEMIALQKTMPKDEEGFVVRYENGLRVKIKGEEYLKIHKMISHMTPLAFWEVMEYGKVPVSYLQQLPEEFRPEFEAIVYELENQYVKTTASVLLDFVKIPTRNTDRESRKQIGLWLKNNKLKHSSAVFPLLDENFDAVDKYVMKQIRPKANEFKELE